MVARHVKISFENGTCLPVPTHPTEVGGYGVLGQARRPVLSNDHGSNRSIRQGLLTGQAAVAVYAVELVERSTVRCLVRRLLLAIDILVPREWLQAHSLIWAPAVLPQGELIGFNPPVDNRPWHRISFVH
jgi:hypothetical protein